MQIGGQLHLESRLSPPIHRGYLGGRFTADDVHGGWTCERGPMALLQDLIRSIADGMVEVIDLTAPLSEKTPIIQLPAPFANTRRFELTQISRYDERGPAWYWNDISTGEHVGTHFDAPIHWVTGREGKDVSQVPARQLIAPAAVIDKSQECSANPDFLLQVSDVEVWEREHGP